MVKPTSAEFIEAVDDNFINPTTGLRVTLEMSESERARELVNGLEWLFKYSREYCINLLLSLNGKDFPKATGEELFEVAIQAAKEQWQLISPGDRRLFGEPFIEKIDKH